jgi:hypothetical protein
VDGKGFFRVGVKLAGTDVAFDGVVELPRVEGFKPRAKPRQLAQGKLFDGFFNIFGGGHVEDVAFAREAKKGGMQSVEWVERPHPP